MVLDTPNEHNSSAENANITSGLSTTNTIDTGSSSSTTPTTPITPPAITHSSTLVSEHMHMQTPSPTIPAANRSSDISDTGDAITARSSLAVNLASSSLQLWHRIDAPSEPEFTRNKHSGVVWKGRLVIFGGHALRTREFLNDVLTYDFEKQEWRTLECIGDIPCRRRAHSCVVLNDMLVFFGGYNGEKCLNDVHILNLETQEWVLKTCTGSIPPCRGGHTGLKWKDNKMIVYGGWDVGNVYYDTTYILHCDPEAKVWVWEKVEVSGDFTPVGRVGHSAVMSGPNSMLIFGGYGGDQYWEDLSELDLVTHTWNVRTAFGETKPCRRTFSSMEQVGDQVLLFGGSNFQREMNDLHIFHLRSNTWERISCQGQVPEGRFAHVTCLYKNQIYLYGGIVRTSNELTGLYRLTLESFIKNNSLKSILTRWIVWNTKLPSEDSVMNSLPTTLRNQVYDYHALVTEMDANSKTESPTAATVGEAEAYTSATATASATTNQPGSALTETDSITNINISVISNNAGTAITAPVQEQLQTVSALSLSYTPSQSSETASDTDEDIEPDEFFSSSSGIAGLTVDISTPLVLTPLDVTPVVSPDEPTAEESLNQNNFFVAASSSTFSSPADSLGTSENLSGILEDDALPAPLTPAEKSQVIDGVQAFLGRKGSINYRNAVFSWELEKQIQGGVRTFPPSPLQRSVCGTVPSSQWPSRVGYRSSADSQTNSFPRSKSEGAVSIAGHGGGNYPMTNSLHRFHPIFLWGFSNGCNIQAVVSSSTSGCSRSSTTSSSSSSSSSSSTSPTSSSSSSSSSCPALPAAMLTTVNQVGAPQTLNCSSPFFSSLHSHTYSPASSSYSTQNCFHRNQYSK